MASIDKNEQAPHIIIDFGSNTIKFGFNYDPFPKFIIPNVVGKIKNKSFSLIKDYNDYYCGYEALNNGPAIDLTYPRIENDGQILSTMEGQKELESLFSYILYEKLKLKTQKDKYNIFIVDSILTSTKEREAIAHILFEKFDVYNLHFEPQSIMTLYSTSKTSGLIVDSGEISTEIVPIIEGYIISQGICNFPIGGCQLTKRFANVYQDIFDMYNVCNQYWMAQKIKEEYSEILPSNKEFEDLMSKPINKKEYSLPDGNTVELGNEIYEIPESIFNPNMIDIQTDNLPKVILDSINKCDISTRKELFNNIILGGGNTFIKGFEGRLKNEINSMKKRNCGIICLKERKYSSWIGASGISSLSNFNKWISRNDYFEHGGKLFEYDYLFNFNDRQRKKMKKEANRTDDIYRKLGPNII